MKGIHIKAFTGTAMVLFTLFSGGCSKILEETPRGIYEPGYLETENGIMGSVTALYAHLRLVYGNAYYFNACLAGTDEATWGSSGGDGFKTFDLSGLGEPTAQINDAAVLWNSAFPYINTANAVIEKGPGVGVTNAVIAEARFFRAFDYFMLVQTFGGVPLDLGAGELTFNTTTIRSSVRNTVPQVYTKAIFPDLLKAVNDLPVTGRVTGGATKTVARFYLAKAYLTYGWWLENPKNIPTYPETSRTDPDGHDAQWYFQQAYNVATTAIDNPGPFRLEATFYDVNLGSNDRNKESLLYADHTESSEFYNGSSLTYASGGDMDNFAGWMLTWTYQDLRSSATPWSSATPVSSVQREAVQSLGRPWVRMAPPIGVFKNTFSDKVNDSRYDGTFVTAYRGNWPKGGVANASLYNANDMPVYPGDAILTFLDEEPATTIDYSNSKYKSNVGAGVLPGRADFVISPNAISRIVYPGMWKMGPYRTDNGSGLGQPNAGSTRPFNIAKFSELYFIAAEAAVKGATTSAGKSARDLLNVIRARAGKWRWYNKGNVAKIADYSAVMTAATPATIDINYILAERSREYYGEGYRWYDLVRTQKWDEIGGSYTICGTSVANHTPLTVTRTIKPYHYLRPVPLGQLQGMEMSEEERTAYQNPGYR
jgi:starch-binding outer membrane protein, SusD/RagB family